VLAAERFCGHSWFRCWDWVALLTGLRLEVRYFVRVRRILSVSSREFMYDNSARSTSFMGHVVSAGMMEIVCLSSSVESYDRMRAKLSKIAVCL
jgi:hypothetical protein